MRLAVSIFALTFVASIATAASAAVIVPIRGLFNTGVNDNNFVLGDNAIDPHWRLTAAPALVTLGNTYTGVRNANFPIGPWLANTATSRWLTPTVSHTNGAVGLYTYELQFTLTPKMIASTGQFTGRSANDNALESIFLNTTRITAPAGGFTSWTNFSSAGGFVAGLNTLTFNVRNAAGTGRNPTGFRVEFLTNSIEVLPEPGTWALLVTGFGLVGAGMRRKRAGATA